MKDFISKELKGLCLTENFKEVPEVRQEKCLTLQDFKYKCERNRMETGAPFGGTLETLVTFTVRVNADNFIFHERLNSHTPYDYSFIFNASFDNLKKMNENEGIIVVKGYVVDVEELFDTSDKTTKNSEQMLVKITLLGNSITYVGMTNDKELFIAK